MRGCGTFHGVGLIVMSASEIEPYLRELGLLVPSGSDVAVERVARRNLIHTVTWDSGGYIVKQGVGPEGSRSLANEAAVYRRLATHGDSDLGRYFAGFVAYDTERDALTVELVGNAENLRDYHIGVGHFSITLGRALGNALGALHSSSSPTREQPNGFANIPPWILSLHRPDLNMLGHASSANLELIKTVQQVPELGEYLDALRGSWVPTTLIHNDMRWDNCVVHGKRGSRRRTRLKLIDLELAQLGDPLWDVGCALSDYLSLWVTSIPMTGEAPPDHFTRLSRYPLHRMQPAIRALWRAYLRRAELDSTRATPALHTATRYAAARLIHTAFERTQLTTYLAGTVICMLQLSLNIFEQTADAAAELFGLPSETTGPQ